MAESSPPQAAPPNSLLTGGLRRTVFLLALPVFLEQFLSFFVGFFDTYLSGRISSEATGAVGLAAYVGWLASMLFGLVGTGTTALVARHWGAGEFDDANRVLNRSLAIAAVMGIVVCFFVFVVSPLFARLLGMDGQTRDITIHYLRIDALGYLFTGLTLVGAAALRGTGDTRTPMYILGIVNILNMAASAALTFGVGPFPNFGIDAVLLAPLGVNGIVLGTVIARTSGGVLMLAVLGRASGKLHLRLGDWSLRGETVRRILRIGGPAVVDGSAMWIGQFLFLMIVSRSPGDATSKIVYAAHVIGIRIEAITYLPAIAWGIAAGAIVGQSLGAQHIDRARRVAHEAVLQCSLLGLLISVLFFARAPQIYELMHKEPSVREVGIPALRLMAFFQVPLVWSIVYVSALRGAGDTRSPLLFTLLGVYLIRLPVAYLCGIVLDGGLFGAWIGMNTDVAFRAMLVTVRYSRGRWIDVKV